jgi:hypothetical protein
MALMIGPAQAQIAESIFRAGDGTAYQVLRAASLSSGAEGIRVTTVAGSTDGVGGCNQTSNTSGQPVSAVAGALQGLQNLHPFNAIVRTGLLVPNDINAVSFNQAFGGRLTLGTGAGALNICADDGFDCTGAVNIQPKFALNSNSGGLPTACVANGVSAGGVSGCDGTNVRDTLAFNLPATNDVCNNPASVTVLSTVCAATPSDGFTLLDGQAVVLIYDSNLGGLGFSIGSAGFTIDTNGVNPPTCMANSIVGATSRLDSDPGTVPTDTPTLTPTNTPTVTFTVTSTVTPTLTSTPTLTPTLTFTATNTVTASSTATATATRTQTATATNTQPPTPTRPPIPVVSSPTSPAGLAMIAGLSIGLLWALRRLVRPR